VAAGANPVLITRGIEKTTKALVDELKKMSKEVKHYTYYSFVYLCVQACFTSGVIKNSHFISVCLLLSNYLTCLFVKTKRILVVAIAG
jgi:chaperonin GroEL (HSP60 family)